MIVLAPIPLAILATTATRRRDWLLPIFVCSTILWAWFHWWIIEVSVAGVVPLALYLACFTTLATWFLRVLSTGSPRLPLWLSLLCCILFWAFLTTDRSRAVLVGLLLLATDLSLTSLGFSCSSSPLLPLLRAFSLLAFSLFSSSYLFLAAGLLVVCGIGGVSLLLPPALRLPF